MPDIRGFASIEALCAEAQAQFDRGPAMKLAQFRQVFGTLNEVLSSLGIVWGTEAFEGTRKGATVEVLMQALETVLAMFFMSRDGFWEEALVLNRNYAELMAVAMAVGYDQQCYVDWKHERQNFSSFDRICARLDGMPNLPVEERALVPLLKRYWAESSQQFSHRVKRSSVRTLVKDGRIRLEPKVAKHSFQETRLNALRNMLANILSVLVGVTDYGRLCSEARVRFPQGAAIIARVNACFPPEWKTEKTT